MNNSSIAIITARGGSKRIPKKNIKEFCGKPIISYSIEAAKRTNLFSEVMVSTDDIEIAEIAKSFGASVPFLRSKETSNDYASTNDVLFEVISQYQDQKRFFEYACCIYPTAPFITPDLLCETYHQMINEKASAIMPVVRFSYPPQRALQACNKKISYWLPENAGKRSQDLCPLYHDAGQFYWFNIKNFLNTRKILTNDTIMHECTEDRVQDIDNESDWKIAEMKFILNP